VGKKDDKRKEQVAPKDKGRSKEKGKGRKGPTESNDKPKARKLTAKTADKHDLYQRSVQNPEEEVKFVANTFKRLRQRPAESLREDFCGTAYFSRTWVESGPPSRSATGIDIDAEVLAWGMQRHVAALPQEQRARVRLVQRDVREASTESFDIVAAFNFSYWIFKTRPTLRQYFEAVRGALKDDGLFFLDAYGGWEAHEPMEEKRAVKGGFTYVWDQAKVDPIDNGVLNHIHFHFKDGTKLKRAFTYDWRLWSLPEIRELLEEAGFREVTVYWDDSDDEGEESYRPKKRAANQPGWLAYIVAQK
jgi:SAM-dependent methyltransferase